MDREAMCDALHWVKTANGYLGAARVGGEYYPSYAYRLSMKLALSYINKIKNPDKRKKFASMWFSAFNKTNTELRKSS